ncbi:MAG TPA: N-acetylmuramoyl-L-alanine amidase [Longimicrobium sp.]|nr:N-acetylmuramoyl-L-alanine amidase [Longimicrobium sp.]
MMRIPVALLSAALLSIATTTLSSQAAAPAWRLEGRTPTQVREAVDRGYAALPVSSLAGLGAELAYEGESVVARFAAGEVRFTPGSPVVSVGGAARTLGNPVYSDGGQVYVPVEFFARYLADAAAGGLQVDIAERVVRLVAAAGAPGGGDARPAAGAGLGASASVTRSSGGVHRRLVVVDAGHGGVDPGAHGPAGTREKDVTLRVARMVADLLRADPTLDVRMTRDRDTLIALHDRARFANRWRSEGQPAVFISIHCNANESRSEKGYETYFLSEARTADARRVEAFENASVQYEEQAPTGALAFILTDLRQNHYLRESGDWAQMIQDGLQTIHPGPNRGVKQAGFAVLRGTFMPSVLVEIGFLTNAREEQLLVDREMEASIARRLADSVRAYFGRPGVRTAAD